MKNEDEEYQALRVHINDKIGLEIKYGSYGESIVNVSALRSTEGSLKEAITSV